MATQILSTIASWIMNVISTLGYGGVILLMAIESANIPLPSEIIMPFSGFLIAQGELNLWLVGLAGAIGCVLGSIFSYWLGAWGGRPLIEKYGKYIFISHHDLDLADKWFKKHGEVTVFVGRLLPVIRTFISFPAGIARMNFWRFVVYSFLGSLPWSLALAFLGQKLGENWESLRRYFHGFDWIILGLIVIGIVWWIRRHLKQNSKH
ncbi:MAG: DedA family protein [Patescibacteria group bacterium]|nr:DedA family protein [Patescibacteria group bacterium]